MGTRTELETNERTEDVNGDGGGNGPGLGTRTGVEARGRTHDGNGDRSGDVSESSSEVEKGDED